MRYLFDCVQLGGGIVGMLFLALMICGFVWSIAKSIPRWRQEYDKSKLMLWLAEATAGFTFAGLIVLAFLFICAVIGFVVKLFM